MFGNVMSNSLVNSAIESGKIAIIPFARNSIRSAYYPLRPKMVFCPQENGREFLAADLRVVERYEIPANGYVIVEIAEVIRVCNGIVAHFLPSSNLIEKGIGLTCGKIEHPYGQNLEPIRFGVKNLQKYPIHITEKDRLAYAYFIDMTGLNIVNVDFTEREAQIIARRLRRDGDDGVVYRE